MSFVCSVIDMYLPYISGYYSLITQCGCGGEGVNTDDAVSGNLIRSQRQANSAVLEDALGAILNHFKQQGISIPGLYHYFPYLVTYVNHEMSKT